jgi:hypothetical protein
MTLTLRFGELPLGGRFEFRGRRYEKLALSLARDEERCGNIFQAETLVCAERADGAAPMLPTPVVVAPVAQPWTCRLSLAPGQRR